MSFNSLRFILSQALLSLIRNIWLSLASILTVTISLVLLGSSIIFLANTANIAQTFESQVKIAVFLDDSLNDVKTKDIENQIKSIADVATVAFTSKDQAILDLQNSMGTRSLLEDLGGKNPLPDKITIVATDASLVENIAAKVKKIEGVKNVSYGQGILEKLIAFTHWLRWIGIGVVAAFSCASLLLITLNIKTNVNHREKEIQIMRLVGASNSFIRWPFFIEGLVIGLIGAGLAILVVGFSYNWLLQYIITSLAFMPIVASQLFIITVLLVMLLAGMFMGALASVFSVRKFLHF